MGVNRKTLEYYQQLVPGTKAMDIMKMIFTCPAHASEIAYMVRSRKDGRPAFTLPEWKAGRTLTAP